MDITSAVNLLTRKIRNLFGRSLVRRVSYSNGVRYFQVQQRGGAAMNNVEHIEPFGFTSHPTTDAEALVLAFNGNGSHSVAIVAGDQRYRLEIEEGEAAIYNIEGDKVHIKKDRTISVEAATKVELNTPEVACTGKLTVAESIEAGDYIKAGTNVEAGVDVLAAANVTATALVSGATIATASGAATMSESGAMEVTDVVSGGISFNGHTHIAPSSGGSTGGPQ